MTTPGFGILMILASVTLAFGLALAAIARVLRGHPTHVGRLALAGGAWAVVYVTTLLAVSLESRADVLAWNADKKFCGFYLDCHSQIAVTSVEVLDSLDDARPQGRFHVVTLRVGSDAKVARMRLHQPRLTVTDSAGRSFDRSPAGETALARTRGPQRPLTEEVEPGGSYPTTVVFDLPADTRAPRLAVTQGWWVDRLIEFLLIGDEDSFLHARTTIQLST